MKSYSGFVQDMNTDPKLARANIRLAIILGLIAAAIFTGFCWSYMT